MSSDSEQVTEALRDKEIEQSLRRTVHDIFVSEKHEDLTFRRVRKFVEESLHLKAGFLKEGGWNERSKSIIKEEVDQHEKDVGAKSSPPPAVASGPDKHAAHPKLAGETQANPAKRRKLNKPQSSNSDVHHQQQQSAEQAQAARRKKPTVDSSESELSDLGSSKSNNDIDDDAPIDPAPETHRALEEQNGTGIESSELSDVIDEMPKPRRKKKQALETKGKASQKKGKPKKEKPSELSPDEDEIKRLKGWLVKCGIRKMWYRELQPYDTPKAKIKHLKEMLSEVGMTGRYSQEKANQIRETRELAEDLEAVQAGNKHWGRTDDKDDEAEESRPRRRVAKGLEGLDFLNDDDGEETD